MKPSDRYEHDELCHCNDAFGGICNCGAQQRFEDDFHGPPEPTLLFRAMRAATSIRIARVAPRPATLPVSAHEGGLNPSRV